MYCFLSFWNCCWERWQATIDNLEGQIERKKKYYGEQNNKKKKKKKKKKKIIFKILIFFFLFEKNLGLGQGQAPEWIRHWLGSSPLFRF
jgi:hypothetical protein